LSAGFDVPPDGVDVGGVVDLTLGSGILGCVEASGDRWRAAVLANIRRVEASARSCSSSFSVMARIKVWKFDGENVCYVYQI